MSGVLIRSQVRRAGVGPLATPIAAAAAAGFAGWATSTSWSPAQSATLLTWLSQLFAIAAGLSVAVAVTGDALVELNESTPTSFRRVLLSRGAVVLTVGLAAAAAMFVPLHVLGVWPHDAGWRTLIVPAGEVAFLGAVAIATSAYSGLASATTISVVAAWIFVAMVWDPYVLPLHLQRGLLLLAAAVLFAVAWVRLGDPERNLALAVAA